MNRVNRFFKILTLVVGGGLLLQTTAGCEEVIAPLLANIASSLILNALLGGFAV